MSVWTETAEGRRSWQEGQQRRVCDRVGGRWSGGEGWWVHRGKGKGASLMERVRCDKVASLASSRVGRWAERLPEILGDAGSEILPVPLQDLLSATE